MSLSKLKAEKSNRAWNGNMKPIRSKLERMILNAVNQKSGASEFLANALYTDI